MLGFWPCRILRTCRLEARRTAVIFVYFVISLHFSYAVYSPLFHSLRPRRGAVVDHMVIIRFVERSNLGVNSLRPRPVGNGLSRLSPDGRRLSDRGFKAASASLYDW